MEASNPPAVGRKAGLVVLDHGQGYRTLYCHLQEIVVVESQEVRRGMRLGTAGSTGCSSGPHLHLGVEFLGRDVDPYGWCGSPTTPEDPWAIHPAGAPIRWLWAHRPSPCPIPAGAIVVDEEQGLPVCRRVTGGKEFEGLFKTILSQPHLNLQIRQSGTDVL